MAQQYHLTGEGECGVCGHTYYFQTHEDYELHVDECKKRKCTWQKELRSHVRAVYVANNNMSPYHCQLTYTCTVCNNFTRAKESDVLKHLEETCLYQARTRELDEFLMQKGIPVIPADLSGSSDSASQTGSDFNGVTEDETLPKPPPNAVHLSKEWRNRYLDLEWQSKHREQRLSTELPQADGSGPGTQLCVAVVGQAGVGKGCVINHIMNSPDAALAGDAGSVQMRIIQSMDFPFIIKDIPGFDGASAEGVDAAPEPAPASGRRRFNWFRRPARPAAVPAAPAAASQAAAGDKMRRTSVKDFLGNEEYGLLNPKAGSADAVCIVLSKRLNPDVFKIFKSCVDAGKLVFFVVTYSENEADLSGDMEMLAEKKKQRFADVILNPWVEQNCAGPDLALLKTTPTFFVVTRLQGTTCNGDDKLQAAMRETDIKRLAQQRALLDFPALLRFLQTSLVPELRLRGHSSALVHHAIEPLTKMKFLSGAAQVASSATVVGMAGSAAFVVMRALQCAFTMLSKVGIIPDAAAQDMSSSSSLDDVMNKMDTVTNGAGRLSLWQRASSAVGIGKVTDVVRNALWVTLGTAAASMADDLAAIILASAYIGMLPFIGSAFYVATLVRMRKQIGAAVEQKAAVWHRKWIQQHVSLQEWPDAIYPFGASAADS